nr:uncharacterized protein LOC112007366 [Quercus suber]
MSIKERRVVAEPAEVLEHIPLDENNPEKFTRIEVSMEKKTKQELVQFLKKSIDVFTWSHDDIPKGIRVVLKSPKGDKLKYTSHLQYQKINNEAEYEALLKGLELAKSLRAESIVVQGDFQVIINQVNGICGAKEGRMKRYLDKMKRLGKKFKETNFVQIPREENVEANALTKAASLEGAMDEYDKVQYMPSIDLPEVQQIDKEENWMTPIVFYLKDGRLLEYKNKARKFRIKAAKYVLIDKVLYKRFFSQPYLRCLASNESNYVFREVHEGVCGNHSGARALVHKVVHAGYYWPTIQVDAKAYVKVCDQCQCFSNVPKQPSEYLTPMMAPWPFAQWGLDILGPFPLGTRQMKFLVVRIDYFTKNFCKQFGIKNYYSSPSHPQANGQAKVVNRSLLKVIKTRLERAKGVWSDELPDVLLAYKANMRTPIGETPFKLAYGSEAVIPAEVHMVNHRVMKYRDEDNEEQLRLNLDLIDEVRIDMKQRTVKYKNLMPRQ